MPTVQPAAIARNALVACDGCGNVFLNWSRTSPVCRACGGAALHEIRWPARG